MSSNIASTNSESLALPTVYIETSVVSYLTARPSRDVEVLGHQMITRRWWRRSRLHYQLVTSELTLREAAKGRSYLGGKAIKATSKSAAYPIIRRGD